jgi:hypothetical protein
MRGTLRYYRRVPVTKGVRFVPSISTRKATIKKGRPFIKAVKGFKAVAPAPLTRLRPTVRVSTSTKASSNSLADLMETKMKSSTSTNFIEDALTELAPPSVKKAIKITQNVLSRINFYPKVQRLGSAEEEDVMSKTTTGVTTRRIGDNTMRVFKLKDSFSSVRGRIMRKAMADHPKTTVILRDDATGLGMMDNAGIANTRAYSTCGMNRKGVFAPFPDFSSPECSNYTTTNYYPTRGFYSPGFFMQDYNRMLFLELLYKTYATGANYLTANDLDAKRITFPVSRRRMITTITNRDAYTPTQVTIYVLRAKTTLFGTFAISPAQFRIIGARTDGQLQSKYIFADTTTPLMKTDGTTWVDRNVVTESSVALTATPQQSDDMTRVWDVVKVRKFVLNPNDIMEYTLSVGMDGFDLETYTQFISADSSAATRATMHSAILVGDYQLLITFQGANKVTAGRRLFVPAVPGSAGPPVVAAVPAYYNYPNQLAISNVTTPAEISVQTRVSMDIHQEDPYDLKLPIQDRPISWDGSDTWASGVASAPGLEKRMAMNRGTYWTLRNQYPVAINAAFADMKDPADGSTPVAGGAGYYIQVPTDDTYRTVNSQSDAVTRS